MRRAGRTRWPILAVASGTGWCRIASSDRLRIASWIIAAAALAAALFLHLVPALLAGLLVYELVHVIAPRLPVFRDTRGKVAAVTLISTAIVVVLVAAMWALVAFLKSDAGSLPNLLGKMADILEGARGKLPGWIVDSIPADTDAIKDASVAWLKEHSKELRVVGGEVGHAFVHRLIAMVIGAMVSLREALPAGEMGPLAEELVERARRVGDAFRRVVFAQVRISALNTFFTAIYLAAVLPMMGVHLPYTKTLIAITFLAGLLPVIGNLISNTVIVVVSLSVSLTVGMASLAFLIVIHTLEYFLNARIVGTQIRASPWELLLAMLVMEATFGLPGLAVAPIYYAYLKDELSARELI
jgi:predicted PurR-regulated permease PerM